MNARLVGSSILLTVLVIYFARPTARAQVAKRARPAARAQVPKRARRLAPGVLTLIPPAPEEEETYTGPLHLKGLPTHDFTPNFSPKTGILHEKAKHVVFRHEIWNLEFAFKPLRMIEADVPQPSGKMKRKLIWYMVYRIRNPGNAMVPKPEEDAYGHKTYATERVDELDPELMADRFYPIFVLEGWSQDLKTNKYQRIAYTDRVIPAVVPRIRAKEDPAIPLLNSVRISQVRIPLSDDKSSGVWGVVTWEDIDPRIDYVSIYIQGLTNAFRFRETPDGKRIYRYKTLQLNFWRPGDTVDEIHDEIRYGVPLVSDPLEQARVFQMYRIPGPVICGYEVDEDTARTTRLFEADAQLDEKFRSSMREELSAGSFPDALRDQFSQLGIRIPEAVTLETVLSDKQWEFQVKAGGRTRTFRLAYEAKYWQMTPSELDVRERVDHLWVYR